MAGSFDLQKIFSGTTDITPSRHSGMGVIVSRDVYEAYLDQYRQSLLLCDALQTVLDDGEHQLIMQESRDLNYHIPDEEEFARLVDAYRVMLHDIDAFYHQRLPDDRVRLHFKTAAQLEKLSGHNDDLTGTIFRAVMRTEYLRRFTDWKRSGFPYCGPSALQEAYDVMVAVRRADTAMENNRTALRQKKLWDRIFAPLGRAPI